MRAIHIFIFILVLALFFTIESYSYNEAELDTLGVKYKSVQSIYLDASIKAEYAVFKFNNVFEVSKINILVSGKDSASAYIKIYGEEGGAVYPKVDKLMYPPIKIQKTKEGREIIEINFDPMLRIEGHQCFIGLEKENSEIYLVSDKQAVYNTCISNKGDEYSRQLLFDGKWHTGKYSYIIDLIGKNIDTKDTIFTIVDTDVFNKDNNKNNIRNESIALGDINDDLLLDVLCDGKLFINKGDFKYEPGIELCTPDTSDIYINAFADMNNDFLADIFYLNHDESYVLINKEDLQFEKQDLELNIPKEPCKYFLKDVNQDNYPDLIIGSKKQILLFINTKQNTFLKEEVLIDSLISGSESIVDFEIADYDSDGLYDLIVAYNSSFKLYKAFPDFKFNSFYMKIYPISDIEIKHLNYHDINADGINEIILSGYAPTSEVSSFNPIVFYRNNMNEYERQHLNIDYETDDCEDIVFGDIDNNGREDMLLFSSCDCRTAHLYKKNNFNLYELITFNSGLFPVNLGKSGVFADVNNDGLLDLFTWYDDVLVLLKNNTRVSGNYIEVESKTQALSDAMVYSGDDIIQKELSEYTGNYNQIYNRVHLGLGNDNIDSVQFNNATTKLNHEVSNDIFNLDRLDSEEFATQLAHNVQPNPVQETTCLTICSSESLYCEITITDIGGKLVGNLYSGKLNIGDNKFYFNRNSFETVLNPGVYFYFVRAAEKLYSGKILVID